MPLTSPDGYLDFTNAVPRAVKMVATSNVGIGTSSPIYALDVHGTSNTGPLTVSSLTLANGAIEGDLNISGNLVYTSNTTTVVNSNVVVEYTGPHGRDPKEVPLKKYPEILFAEGKFDANDSTNTYVQAGYTVTASSRVALDDYKPYNAFNGTVVDDIDAWVSGTFYTANGGDGTRQTITWTGSTQHNGEYIKLKLPHKLIVKHMNIKARYGGLERTLPRAFTIIGSNDNTNWETIHQETRTANPNENETHVMNGLSKNTAFIYIALVPKNLGSTHTGTSCSIGELEYYGYEEDPPAGDSSLDTTFKSVLNTPQTTGVQVYVDAKLTSDFTNQMTDPTPTGTATTYDSTGKYWEINGELTSNITVEANTFLEGDQPHAVSVWFNSSNLEANTANTCVFSVSDQEKLDSYNLDLQSNTWHNLTYAYQGEGGSRVTYLDGRKVSKDQAEDTFGKYPPIAMTGYSQSGYVVSASSELGAAYLAHEAFNGTFAVNGDCWLSGSAVYDSGTGTYNGNANLGSDSGGPAFSNADKGEWLKLEMPYRFLVDYISICGSTTTTVNPKDWKIYGSNDDKNWDVLLSKTNSITAAFNATSGKEHIVGASKAYKYFALVVTKSGGHSGDHYIQVGELEYYGHRENDLVRLPDPTNVLKYPHIAMTGPAQRGYTTRDAQLEVNNDPYETRAWKAFRGTLVTNTDCYFGLYVSGTAYYYNTDGTWNSTSYPNVKLSSQTPVGDYITLGLPHKLVLNSFDLTPRNLTNTNQGANESADSFEIWGSNDNSTWYHINTYDNSTDQPSSITPRTFTVNWANSTATPNTPTAYKHIGLVVKKIFANLYSSNRQIFTLGRWRLYGTGVDSVPIQIGGGNIDKVANFRVYDKFVEEDQALEIWDAQKDEFGRAKSSMTLHKGRLGIGTDEPEGRLAVLDEPHNLEEFPPRAMMGYKTHFEGHGEFCVKVSSNNTNYEGWKAFNKAFFGGEGWMSEDSPDTYTQGTGIPNSTTAVFNGKIGEWLHIELPYKIRLKKTTILQRANSDHPRPTGSFTIWGSNDKVNWDEIITGTHTRTVPVNEPTGDPINRDIDTSKFYSSYVFQVHSIIVTTGNEDTCHVAEWKLFGTREQGQSVLHDGQLTLTNSVTVPRIGPALDADDTPRRDRLVVEYNTSTNPTFEGAVRDTSGRGNDSVFIGTASYDANEKAFEFDGNSDYVVSGALGIPSGAFVHSVSLWFKRNSIGSNMYLTTIGGDSGPTNTRFSSMLQVSPSQANIHLSISGSNSYFSSGITTGAWFHLVYTYNGGAQGSASTAHTVYVNGVKKSISGGTGSGTLNLPENSRVALGSLTYGGSNYLDGSISNFKLYDKILTAEEAKTLYDMGRCDEGHHVVNFSKTRVGIGLGDGEAPKAALDVRGDVITKASIGLKNVTSPISPVDIRNTVLYDGETGTNFNPETMGAINIRHGPGNDYSMWNITCHNNNDLYFLHNQHTATTDPAWGVAGYLMDNSAQGQLTFTGQHRTFIKDVPFSQASDLEGLIVSSNQNKYVKLSGGIEAGSNAITINESLPIVSLSNVVEDKRCFGVISASEDPENRSDAYGSFVTPFEKEKGDTRVYINSVGEGAIWVVNTGGPLESGDYITTSNVAGYGQKQDSEFLANYTVAKITMDCDFEPVIQPVQVIKKDEEGENILDEHGQIQWEDHPTETERAYKVRYLTTDGIQTDEANAVHIAAFVGCTYHCG